MAIENNGLRHVQKKRGTQSVARSTYLGSRIALSVETSNDESPT